MKLLDRIKIFLHGLAFGMKQADDIMLTQGDGGTDIGSGIHQETTDKRVSKALLKGEVTQAVKELRYRTYKVDREAKNYEYFGPRLAKKYEGVKDETKFVKYENSENLPIITIQQNELCVEDIMSSIDRVDENTGVYTENNIKEYTIKIERDFVPRFRLEEFTKRVVVKKVDDSVVMIDFYVPKYANPHEWTEVGVLPKSKGFITEVERIINGGRFSDVFDFKRVSFLTSHAYKLPDMIYFSLVTPIFKEIVEYDGHYVIKFRCVIERQEDEVDQYYDPIMDKKYQEHEAKETTIDLDDVMSVRTYVCERCGKEMIYDPVLIDAINPTEARDIDEEIDTETRVSALEYLDAEMAEQTTGHIFCKECLQQYLKEQEEIKNLK